MIKFYQSTSEDKRMYYASKCLEKYGLERVKSPIRADFVFCPINAKDIFDYYPLPVLAGNIDEKENVFYSRPCIIGREGIKKVFDINLSKKDAKNLKASIKYLQEMRDKCGIK